ncbi:hypothetical protein LIER_41034 [Lithospermum erythrorhizon]|uniref:Uncharacterized protein n=1 Tax=Lithospermum erythrorhizon TaxID=34254 RepID=A0AAV3R945_LITER
MRLEKGLSDIWEGSRNSPNFSDLVIWNMYPEKGIGRQTGYPILPRQDTRYSLRGGAKELGREICTKIPSTRLRDFVTNTIKIAITSSLTDSPLDAQSSGTTYPIAHSINYDRFSHMHFLVVAATKN